MGKGSMRRDEGLPYLGLSHGFRTDLETRRAAAKVYAWAAGLGHTKPGLLDTLLIVSPNRAQGQGGRRRSGRPQTDVPE